MLVAVAGGRLQGLEAVYLARLAGWRTLLLDRDEDVPARGICDRFARCDLADPDLVARAVKGCDVLIPALENPPVLASLGRAARAAGVAFAFDPRAYAVSSSKLGSNRLFARLGLDLPGEWPGCGLPVVVKPDSSSGSQGVEVVRDRARLEELLSSGGPLVVQGYVPGPTFSIEVLGWKGRYRALQVTDLFMDPAFDCKRVLAPTSLAPGLVQEMERMALVLAEALDLNGIMDLEVVLEDGRLPILEIDARLPSQTPTAVYWSSGLNLVELLVRSVLEDALPPIPELSSPAGCLYEHIRVGPGRLEVRGEHIMGSAGPLSLVPGFMGVDQALTDHRPGAGSWVATMIYHGDGLERISARRQRVLEELCRQSGLTLEDQEP